MFHRIFHCLPLLCVYFTSITTCNALYGGELELSVWARQPMLKDPVALEFDHQGRLYVVESARRSTVDIDIRRHKEWILDDLANQSVADLRRFFRDKMASEHSEANRSWLLDRNEDGLHDWQDLMTITETVRLLEDRDGDGQADRSTVFADRFQEEITGVAAGVLPVGDDVLMTVYPDLWRLTDSDGDGKSDVRSSVYRGFGVHAAFDGHDLHGLTFGPDGKIYFTVGDNGFSIPGKADLHYPNTGGVLRMNPDGSALEVFAYGLRNVQEIAFDEYGNLFSVDNDGDLADERERFVYIVEGGDSGWRLNWQFRTDGWAKYTGGPSYNPWIRRRMWEPHHSDQPAYIVPPISNYSVGPGGFKYNPGTALNSSYDRYFFLCQFPVQKITAFRVRPVGASFVMTDEHILHSGLMASAVNFGPDGALYIADWDGKWDPNQRGTIYKLDDPESSGSSTRRQVAEFLRSGMNDAPRGSLQRNLGHADVRVRRMAQFELVRRGDQVTLLSVAQNRSAHQLARIHALWGIRQLEGLDEMESWWQQLPWHDQDVEVRAQVAKLAGDLALVETEPSLRHALKDDSVRVRFHAAIAIGKLPASNATLDLFEMLRANANRDPMIRHAATMGLSASATGELLAARHHHSRHVRSGVVVALRRRQDPTLSLFLDDVDGWVRREAAMAIHDDFSSPAALDGLAKHLSVLGPEADEAILRRAISANFRLARNADAQRLLEFALDSDQDAAMRLEALRSLERWNDSRIYDRVVGRIRHRKIEQRGLAKRLLQQHVAQLLHEQNEALEPVMIEIVRSLQLDAPDDVFLRWLTSPQRSPIVRLESLKTLLARGSDPLERLLPELAADRDTELANESWAAWLEQSPTAAITWLRQQWDALPANRRQSAVHAMAQNKQPASIEFLREQVDAWHRGNLADSLRLDVFLAADQTELAAQLNDLVKDESLLYQVGGDARRGRQIFESHVTAQCVRCHQAGGGQSQAGPELEKIGARADRAYLVEALIKPSQTIAKGYQTVVLETDDGRQLSGSVIQETDEYLILISSDAKQHRIAKTNIEARATSKLSNMPSMKGVLSPLEIRDLVEYLANQK